MSIPPPLEACASHAFHPSASEEEGPAPTASLPLSRALSCQASALYLGFSCLSHTWCPSRTSLSHPSGGLVFRLLIRWASLTQVASPLCIILTKLHCQAYFPDFPSPWTTNSLQVRIFLSSLTSMASITLLDRIGGQEVFG